MRVAPGAATPATDRREVARALVSSPLPLPTTTRLVLLVLVAAAGATFATWWWLVLGRGNWQGAQLACLPVPETPETAVAASPDAVLSRFTGCVNDVRLAQSAVVLCGPLALLALALLGRAAGRRLNLWRWAAAKADEDSSLAARLTAVLPDGDDAGGGPRPTLWVRRRRVGVRARASGTVRRPWIVADSNVFNLADREVEAIFRHELAHLRLRDVSRVRLAAAAWWILLMGVTLPMGAALVLNPGLLGMDLLARMTVVLVIFLLTLCAVLRVREHDADLGAEADPRAPVGATADHLGSDLPQNRRGRLLRAAGLASHPTAAARLDVLADPARTWGLSASACLTTGLAAGLLFTDLALLVVSLMPTQVQLAYTLTGLIVGWAVAGVTTVAWWRAVAVGHRDARGRRPASAGAALGLGVLVGSQLSGRAAGDWLRDTGTADGLAAALSLADAPRAQVLALATSLMIGGALFGLWTTALARAARAAVTGPRSAPACAAAVVLSGLMTAVPLGSWFLFARLTAARATPDIRWSVIDTPWWATGFAVTVCGALTPIAWSAVLTRARGRTPAAEAPHDRSPTAGATARGIPPGPPLTTCTATALAGERKQTAETTQPPGRRPAESTAVHRFPPEAAPPAQQPSKSTTTPRLPPEPAPTTATESALAGRQKQTAGTEAAPGRRPAEGAAVRRFPPVAVFVVAGVVVAAGAGWATVGGRFAGASASSAGRSSGPPATVTVRPGSAAAGGDETVPLGELPVLPPAAERTPQLRTDTALVCRALTLGGTVVWTDPERRRDTADLLGGLDDTVLRSASAVLLRDLTGPVDRDALVASVLRCDLYSRYRR
ncbi:M48 family metalloprotease [Streptomyces sp. NPDC050263]|uniref:M48 family metalloprotease n=1 Tax=Streptomyces sp. NPDC050263 TaxID=3155037 RepID=UPI003438A89E